MTPARIEPATFRFVAQHLNHCATAVPHCTCERVKCHCVLCWLSGCQYCHDGPESRDWTEVFASVLVHATEESSGMFATNGIYSTVTNALHKSM